MADFLEKNNKSLIENSKNSPETLPRESRRNVDEVILPEFLHETKSKLERYFKEGFEQEHINYISEKGYNPSDVLTKSDFAILQARFEENLRHLTDDYNYISGNKDVKNDKADEGSKLPGKKYTDHIKSEKNTSEEINEILEP